MVLMAAGSESLRAAALLAGMLAAAVVGVRLARLTHAPRVVGYLLVGIALHFVLPGFASESHAFQNAAAVVKSLALGLILFAIGAEFDVAHLKAVGGQFWKLTLAETLAVGVGVFAMTRLALGSQGHVQALFLAVAAIATAPAATLHVLSQYEAKGRVTDHILVMTGLNNLIAIMAFYVAFLLFAETGAIHVEHFDRHLLVALGLATLGSATLGLVLGLALSLLHSALTRFETLLVFLAVILAVGTASTLLGLNSLIVCMFIGVAFTNFAIQPHRLRQEFSDLTAPILVLFFVLAGFQLEWNRLGEIGLVGVAFLVMRGLGKVGGAALGVRWIGPEHRVTPHIGAAMLCQAGVAIGLGKFLTDHWGREIDGRWDPDPGAQAVNTVILASVALFELIGPFATKRVVVRAGEVKAISLLSRPSSSVREVRTIAGRLGRLGHLDRRRRRRADDLPLRDLHVRHVMRTNIESLRQDAKMSEVLHFVERSRLNDFFVVDADGHLVGVINFKDLRNLMFNSALAQLLNAYDMANTAPPVALADQPLTEILERFHEHDVGSLPVIDHANTRRLLGVVEQRDVLRALHVKE